MLHLLEIGDRIGSTIQFRAENLKLDGVHVINQKVPKSCEPPTARPSPPADEFYHTTGAWKDCHRATRSPDRTTGRRSVRGTVLAARPDRDVAEKDHHVSQMISGATLPSKWSVNRINEGGDS